MLSAHIAAEHRGLMAPSRHGSARLFHLLSHQKEDEKKALAMASADFAAPSPKPEVQTQQIQHQQLSEPKAHDDVLDKEAQYVKSENAAQEEDEKYAHRSGLGALDIVPERDENVLGSLGGVEDFDQLNRDGSLSGATSGSRNAMGSLFAVHSPSTAEEEADSSKNRPRSALSFRYRRGHWSRDGLLWIVGQFC